MTRTAVRRVGIVVNESREAALQSADELAARDEFKHVIVNDRLDEAVAELVSLVATMCAE